MNAPAKSFRFVSTDRRVREDRRFVVGKGRFAAASAMDLMRFASDSTRACCSSGVFVGAPAPMTQSWA